jgi:GntR family transcriptional repressor for pyruvate dehydrogenase complex
MALHAVRNRLLSDQVFEQLVTEIISGRYAADATLPAERTLAVTLGVNRHVVREAIRRLEQAGLVRVAQGGSTRVLDYRKHAGLDLLSLLAEHARGGPETARFWLAVLELRVAIGAEMARLCARRADRTVCNDLLRISREMRAADNDQALYALEVRFWDRVQDGADNVVCRLALNSMLKASLAMGDVARQWSAQEARQSDFRQPIAEAIAKHDADTAERLTRQALRSVVDQFERALAKPRDSRDPAPAAKKRRRKRTTG